MEGEEDGGSRSKWTVLGIKQIYLNSLKDAYRGKAHALFDEGINNFSKYVNDKIMPRVVYEELSSRYSVKLIEPNTVCVRDSMQGGKKFEVTLAPERGSLKFFCEVDRSDKCSHVFFATMDPTVREALERRGLRPPKIDP